MFSLTVVVTVLLASFVSTQSFSSLPVCAQNCTTNAIPSSCNLNPKCICSDTGFIKKIACCVALVCDQADQEATIKYADGLCSAAGVTNLPTAASCAAGQTATVVGNSTATGSATTSASSTISASLTMSTATSVASSSTSSASSAASVASSSTTSGAAVASSTGDASRAFYAQGLGMVGAAIGAAVALM